MSIERAWRWLPVWLGFLGFAGAGCGGDVGNATDRRGPGGIAESGSPDSADASAGGGGGQPGDAGRVGADAVGPDAMAMARACDHHFAATFSTRCGGPVLPADELARIKTRFVQACEKGLALSDGSASARVEACVSDLETSACQMPEGPPPACDLRGPLPGGAACSEDRQCQSGACLDTAILTPGGGPEKRHCGHCASNVATGENCFDANVRCPASALCVNAGAPDSVHICMAVVEGDVGASCDDLTSRCKSGLYCDGQTSQCARLGDQGAHCGARSSNWPTGCKAPLVCKGAPATCQSPGTSDGPCQTDEECTSGLGCVIFNTECTSGPPCVKGRCESITWVGSGAPCGGAARCLVGSCSNVLLPGGHCPAVIPDGEACNSAENTCDVFAECINGLCKSQGNFVCK